MLSTTDLLTVSTMPVEKDISLQTIQTFYKEHLCDRLFILHLDGDKRKEIKLRFDEKDLCHLLGIQYVVKGLKNKYSFVGKKGYKKLENGSITFDLLKKTNKNEYKSRRKRMLYFPFVYQIIHTPKIIEYFPANNTTLLDLDIIIYSNMDKKYLHLGIDKDTNSDYYYPKSFYDRNKDDHIVGRKQISVVKIEEILD